MAKEIMSDTSLLFNKDAEKEIISACIFDENIYSSVKDLLKDELFVDAGPRKILSIIHDMEREGKRPEFSEIAMRYASSGGDITYFMSDIPSSFMVTRQRIETLRELCTKRRLYELCTKGLQMALSPAADSDDFQTLLSEFSQNTKDDDSSIQSFADTVVQLQNDVADRMNNIGESGIMTGLHIFDVRLGLHPGDLVIFAGATSQGKSSLATTIARNVALQKEPCAYYSLEMGAKQLTARILSQDALMASSRILYDKLNTDEYSRFYDASSSLSELPIYFDERSKVSFDKVCSSIRAMKRAHGIRIAFIDYLQIFANDADSNNREQIIADMARTLKRIAVEEDICIVALSQLSRDLNKTEPSMSRLRGSGQIEEAADVVVLIYRPEVYGIERYSDGTPSQGTAQIKIAKGRNIGLATEIVQFNGDYTFFSDYKEEKQPAPQPQVMPWQKDIQESNLPF